jgi:hypothetical protein
MATTGTSRRSFLRGAIGLLVMSTATPGALLGRIEPTISTGSSGTVVATYTLRLRDFPELKIVGGSVKLVNPGQLMLNPDHQLHGVPGAENTTPTQGWYPIAITRVALDGAEAFKAVSTYCTHGQGYQIGDYDPSTGYYVCPHNYSTFLADGTHVTREGTPDVGNLRAFPTFFNEAEGEIRIEQVLATTSAVGLVDGAPSKLVLDQNYPNPFNPSTLIRYGLPSDTRVKLTVHTLLGNQIKVLVDETQESGFYVYDFAAIDLPPGAYFYRLQTDHGSLTRRMVLAR